MCRLLSYSIFCLFFVVTKLTPLDMPPSRLDTATPASSHLDTDTLSSRLDTDTSSSHLDTDTMSSHLDTDIPSSRLDADILSSRPDSTSSSRLDAEISYEIPVLEAAASLPEGSCRDDSPPHLSGSPVYPHPAPHSPPSRPLALNLQQITNRSFYKVREQ